MTFTRTNSGIANQHIFSRSNIVVYLEGEHESRPRGGIDAALWREFFRAFFPNLGFHFKALGGKTHALEMADRIISASIANSLVAMDRDYDEFFGDVIEDDRIFYTYGYGAENDVLNPGVFEGIVRAFLPGLESPHVESDKVKGYVLTTAREGKVAALSDLVTQCRCISTIDRNKPQSNLDLNRPGLPIKIRKEPIKTALSHAKSMPVVRTPLSIFRHHFRLIPCHFYFYVVFHTFSRWRLTYTRKKIASDVFLSIVLGVIQNNFFELMEGDSNDYYRDLGSRKIERYISV